MSVEPEVEGTLLGRAAQIGSVMARHGLRDRGGSTADRARGFREALEELGPTFAKLGQILSTRPDLLPPEFVAELETLQDRVPPMSEAEVVAVMEEELGVPWEDVFESVEPRPLAAGTIGQVHKARLESGEEVAIKVQRPTAREEILRDLGLLALFAEKTQNRPVFRQVVDVPAVTEQLSNSLRRELDFTQEAANVERLREVLQPFSRLGVPEVYDRYTSARLLVLEWIEGVPVTQAPAGEARSEAARQLVESYFRQILTEGFFHADPHPGNMLWSNDRVYFLDLGMVGEVPPETRELVLLLLMAFWQEDAGFLTEVVLQLGGDDQRSDIDLAGLREELGALLGTYRHASLQELELGPDPAVRHRDQRTPRRAPARVARPDRQGARADAVRRDGARPDARPVLDDRGLRPARPARAAARLGRPEADVLRGPEASRARDPPDRGVRARDGCAAGPEAPGALPRHRAGGRDRRCRPPALARPDRGGCDPRQRHHRDRGARGRLDPDRLRRAPEPS